MSFYDANGNLIQKQGSDGTVKYKYSPDNLLNGVFYSDGQQVSFQYDAMGRKVSRTTASYSLDYLESQAASGHGGGIWHALGSGTARKLVSSKS